MKRAARWFWALVAAQALFLLSWAAYHEVVRQNAAVILLKARPADPQDLLRGDYMTLRYDISDVKIEGAKASPAADSGVGQDVWVLLEPRDRYYVAAQAGRERLTPKPGQVLVLGTVGYSWGRAGNVESIAYGIERYFVPEGKGSPRFKLMEVEASVSPAHRLYIRRVLLDGKAYP